MKKNTKAATPAAPATAIIPEAIFTLEAPPAGGYITKTDFGVSFHESTPIDIWQEEGRHLAQETRVSAFRLADWFIFGETKYPKNYKAAIAATGLEYGTIRNMAVVARRFPMEKRIAGLSFEHHRLLAPVKDDGKVAEIAKKVVDEKLTAAATRQIVPKKTAKPKPATDKQKMAKDKRHRENLMEILKYLADMPPAFLVNWKTVCAEMVEIGEGIAAKKVPAKVPAKKVSKAKK